MAAGPNLRDQLKKILPEILPKKPSEAIKGTELIQGVKYRLNQNYSDATLRYHFSIMSCDPSSPIAKVEQGQGYYFRSTTLHSLESARNLIPSREGSLFGDPGATDQVDIVIARANKFRAIFNRHSELDAKFPYAFERSFSQTQPSQNVWKYPDVALIQWLVGEPDEQGIRLDPESVEVRRRMGGAPFVLSGVRLKLDTHYDSIREDVFKTLSAGLWANQAELAIAATLDDEQLVADVRKLAGEFGVGVVSFGLTQDVIDDLPEPASIVNLTEHEFGALENLFKIRRICLPKQRPSLSWEEINYFRTDNPDFARFYDWIAKCLMDEKAYSLSDFLEIVAPEPAAAEAEPEADAA
ncbi:MAG: hypothetical protein ACI8UO_001292 [Verrucomicrobiales bacterium]